MIRGNDGVKKICGYGRLNPRENYGINVVPCSFIELGEGGFVAGGGRYNMIKNLKSSSIYLEQLGPSGIQALFNLKSDGKVGFDVANCLSRVQGLLGVSHGGRRG